MEGIAMKPNSNFVSRRAFLAGTGAATVVVAAEPQKSIKPGVAARSAARVVGANDRIRVGMIGLGGMGTVHLQSFMKQAEDEKDIEVAALSEIYTRRKERARTLARLTEKDVHHDYRDLLGRNDVDAVLIAAPDHWHGQMALDALAAGKDVYLEKPMTHTLSEARVLVDAVRRYGRVLQVGNQGLSMPSTHKSREIIDAGEIGPLLCAQSTSARNSLLGEWNYHVDAEGTAQNIDWIRWLGPAPKRPFNADRYFRFRKYWDYSGGIATDLFFHSLGPILYAMGPQFPTRVSANGGIYVHKDREVPDTYSSTIEYPNFYIDMSGSMANAGMGSHHRQAIYGHKGTLIVEGNRVLVYPETFPELKQQPSSQPKVFDLPPQAPQRDARTPHTTNFFSCVRSRRQPNAHAELGYQIISAIKLGVYAYREGGTKLFDPASRRIIEKAPPRPEYQGDGQNHSVS
jgi:predicted dehydrogenase